jgi:acyl dehydratase
VRYLEDLKAGETAESAPRQVTESELLAFARLYDPQYFHSDPEAARASSFGGLIASGIFTMAIWRALDHQMAPDIAWICGVAWDDVRFPLPVRPGDTLRARSCCLSARASGKDRTRGIAVFHYELVNQRDELVFTCRSTNLIERRPPRAARLACTDW